jgi:hypothetical protein
MTIGGVSKQQQKINKNKRLQPEPAASSNNGLASKKRIKIDLSRNETREFFSHGKVATMALPDSAHRNKMPEKAAIKAVSTVGSGLKKPIGISFK